MWQPRDGRVTAMVNSHRRLRPSPILKVSSVSFLLRTLSTLRLKKPRPLYSSEEKPKNVVNSSLGCLLASRWRCCSVTGIPGIFTEYLRYSLPSAYLLGSSFLRDSTLSYTAGRADCMYFLYIHLV